MDPSKPASKPKVGSAAGNLPTPLANTAQPKKSFEATLTEKTKPNLTRAREPSAKNAVLAAIEQAANPDAEIEAGLRIVEEQLAIHMSRQVLSMPKPKANSRAREKSEAEEDV
jgi:hypothetical protein